MINVLEYLEITAKKFSAKKAVHDEYKYSTYEELITDSKKIGSYISQISKTRKPIPVFMEKGVDTLKAFFGVAYAGCFYVLINPALPVARIEQILDVLETDFVLTSHCYDNVLVNIEKIKNVIYFEDIINTSVNEQKLQQIRKDAQDIDPLYANFTSGSTGTPKGVVVSHRSVIDFIDVFTEIFDITSDDTIGNQAPFDFDVSVKDIYSAIKTGATLEIVPKSLFSMPVQLADFLCDRNVTTMIWAVSALCLMTTFHVLDYKVPDKVNKILFSGETMPKKHLKLWMEHLPKAMFVNLYGPTEITCNCTYHIVDCLPEEIQTLPIGKAFPNEKVFLLDENNNEVTNTGVSGEICVSGTALSLGYYNNAEETAKRFVQNPLNKNYLETIYRTGDIGYFGEDMNLYFTGRKDFQIKYMGHRIELEEIESALSKINNINRAFCVFNEEKNQLAAFFVGDITAKEIRQQLSFILPVFMIPGIYIPLENIPLTANGKVDRKHLKVMLGERGK